MAISVDKNHRINYYLKSLEIVDTFKDLENKPTIAMHVCCGPCSTSPIEFLAKYFSKILIIYNNSNIYPTDEYKRRYSELIRYCDDFNKKHDNIVQIVEFDYNNEEYNIFLKEYGPQRECGERCQACYTKRMDEAYKYADSLGYDYFCTVMSISRQKSSQVLNLIGENLSSKYKTKYFFSDFKKGGGDPRREELIKEYNMYNQHYCGCFYSYEEYLKKEELK